MDRFAQMEFFVLTADLGSLTRAAERLCLSNAAASRMLSALENRLGVRLLERTTRRLWLTDAGREYHRRCSALLAEAAAADAAAGELSARPRGVLRVTCSVSFALLHIAPWLPGFHECNPELRVQIEAANRYPNFIEAGIDVAVRTREHEGDSGMMVQKLAQTRRVFAASPAYLARRGWPETPEALASHDLLVYTHAADPYVLHLHKGDQLREVRITPVFESNEGQVICAAARAGMGILVQPLYIVRDDIVAGRLVPVLEDWQLPPLTVNLAYQSRRHQPAKIRVFAEALREHMKLSDLQASWHVRGA
ncbi:LysR family transcriptional regulator [Paraburkholderia caribensis]|uniref:LysR family transcriptional regulator n=1 Tax=Paraburkholderia caribensis TaxID=75105 RepID=UPI001D0903C8|nr:LysR family transcriptional regulator [Paraburkholderia caribensis]